MHAVKEKYTPGEEPRCNDGYSAADSRNARRSSSAGATPFMGASAKRFITMALSLIIFSTRR